MPFLLGLLAWILVGLLAGLLARLLLPGRPRLGIASALAVGVAGSLAGGFAATALGFGGMAGHDWRAAIYATICSMIGLLLLRSFTLAD